MSNDKQPVVRKSIKLVPVEATPEMILAFQRGEPKDKSFWGCYRAMLAAAPNLSAPAEPIDMVLHCPKCGVQHIDGPEWADDPHDIEQGQMRVWSNPPHRSHLCHHCGFIWRPADVPTNGVASVKTKGKNDSAPADGGALTDAARDVLAERRRQVESEGWTARHDDSHKGGQMAAAGGCYALFTDAYPNVGDPPPDWPWAAKWWKPFEYRRDLVKAGALILAEIERIDRLTAEHRSES
ncbi:hypothetical protein FAZ95_13970 [Trinickia violacea]|uniref:Uncharacterized protein n=1 Tax=Trinickia violacea TaxID=2571746 RepID=A0A4P8IWJ5_9BURK|nr:hypothetical protein [Trinickia violacea]QCP50189.1 hypothetical protein FAZ95_13970 [Trinickia violacea]